MTHEELVKSFVDCALEEDARENSRFDMDGWGNFFLEDWKKTPEAVEDAWYRYNDIRNRAFT